MMTENNANPVVSIDWLKEHLDDTNLRILDVTWYSAKDGNESYKEKHIPGSAWFNIMEGVVNTDLFPRNLPHPEIFQKQARSVGVNEDSHVILYDSTGNCGFFASGRAWWMFKLHGHSKVSVLDGGFESWEKTYPVTIDVPSIKEGNFTAKMTNNLIRNHKDMVENLSTHQVQVIDTRPAERYNGTKEDGKTGHYPGAVNMTMGSVLLDQETMSLKTADKLKQEFAARGIDLSKPIVGMCNSGMSSCTGALAASICGATNVSVYLGGFKEWGTKATSEQIEQSTEASG